jgi:hypothetical protein
LSILSRYFSLTRVLHGVLNDVRTRLVESRDLDLLSNSERDRKISSKTVELSTNDGKTVTIHFPRPSDMDSFFVFSLHRSGSTLINNIITDVCKHLGLAYIDLEGSMFKQGYMPPYIDDNISSLFHDRGFAYVGFRSFWIGGNYDIRRNKCFLLIRDPRDAIVSHYFSYLYSHGIPSGGPVSNVMKENRAKLLNIDINKYVLRPQFVNFYRNGFRAYETSLSPQTTRVYRYEDVIFYKSEWISDMLGYLGLKLQGKVLSDIVRKHDMRPTHEDPSIHIRQVAPGNFRQHLSDETIKKLNEAFASILHRYGYDRIPTIRLPESR